MFITNETGELLMPRPCCRRHVVFSPQVVYFKPAGVPMRTLEHVTLALDEIEALRLADLNGQYQEQAAAQMKISRPTFSRIIETARRKVADALVNGKALRLEGGPITQKGSPAMPTANDQTTTRPGGGRGPCGGGQRRGPGGRTNATRNCLCPQCGERVPHVRGEPCAQKNCPQCGSRMTRE